MSKDAPESPISTDTTAEELYSLAQSRPDLWEQLLAHPAMYPGLADWIRQQMPAAALPSPPKEPEKIVVSTSVVEEEPVSVAEPAIAMPSVMEVSATDSPIVERPSRRILPVGIAAGLVLVLIIGGGIVWFLRANAPSGGPLDRLPSKAHVATIDGLDGNAVLLPIGPEGEFYLTDGDLRMVLVSDGSQPQVVAVDMKTGDTEPTWSQAIDAGPCTVEEGDLSCGEENVLDVSAKEDADSPATLMAYSYAVADAPYDVLPYAISDGKLLTADGTVLAESFEERAWALPGPENTWMISDGAQIISVKDAEILWSRDISRDDAMINGFDSHQPAWATSDDVVLYAIYGELIAQEITTGDVLWKVEVPLTSYQVTRDMIVVSMGDALALIPLHGEAGRPETPPAVVVQADEVADEKPEPEPEPEPEPDPEPVVQTIDPNALLNGVIEVSEWCAGRVTGDAVAQTFTFTDGIAEGMGVAGASIRMSEPKLVNNDGNPYAVVVLVCDPTARTPVMEVAVYNVDLALVQSLFTWTGVNAVISNDTEITMVDAADNWVTVTSGPWMGFGDSYCLSCGGGYAVTVDYAWTGGQYEITKIIYDTPSGTVAKPSMEVLNYIYGEISSGAESGVSHYFTGGAAEELGRLDAPSIGDNPETAPSGRELYFSPGGGVPECALIPPEETSPHFKETDTSIENFYYNTDIQPGDFICLIDTPHEILRVSPNAHVWWLIRPSGSPDDFQIYHIGRDFS